MHVSLPYILYTNSPSIWICTQICLYVNIEACLCFTYMHLSMYDCIHVFAHMHTHTHTQTHAFRYLDMQACLHHVYVHVYAYAYVHACMHVCMCGCMCACIRMYVCTYPCMYVWMWMHVCVYLLQQAKQFMQTYKHKASMYLLYPMESFIRIHTCLCT